MKHNRHCERYASVSHMLHTVGNVCFVIGLFFLFTAMLSTTLYEFGASEMIGIIAFGALVISFIIFISEAAIDVRTLQERILED